MRGVVAVVLWGLMIAGCGAAGGGAGNGRPADEGVFVVCPDAHPAYAIVATPGPGCRTLVAGRDYAEGRVIIGLEPGVAEDQLRAAIAAYRATVIASEPMPMDGRLLRVPDGTVPKAVVGLAGYSFIAYAQPDLVMRVDQST